jgi:hypothetical protein
MSTPSNGNKRPTTRPTHSRRSSDPSEPVFQEDGPLVGSADILSSPNVIEPEFSIRGLNNKPIPTPSIYRDARGQIFNLLVGREEHAHSTTTTSMNGSITTTTSQDTKQQQDSVKPGKRINIVQTCQGAMRSGDLHPNTQCSFVFEGSVEVWIPQRDGSTKKFKLGPRDYFEVPAYVPHVEHFLQDTIHAEWWEANDVTGANGFRHWLYAPYRRLVDLSFEWGHGDAPRGTLKLLREAKLIEDPEEIPMEKNNNDNKNTRWMLALGGILIGSLGFVLGRAVAKRT